MNKLPVFEIFLKEDDDVSLALVEDPAIQANFIYFANEAEQMKFVYDVEQQIVKGPALVPNKLMFRKAIGGYVYYSKDTIKKFVESFMNKTGGKINLSHSDNFISTNIIESYFASEINEFDVPEGSWIVSARIKDQDVWSKVKAGEFNGFSIEATFYKELVDYYECFKKEENRMSLKEQLLNAINSVIFPDEVEKVQEEVETPVETPVETFNSEEEKVVEEEVKVEEKVEEPKVELFNLEEMTKMMDELKTSLSNSFDEKLNAMKSEMKKEMSKVNEQVEKFANQPISTSVKEEVINTSKMIDTANNATKYFVK